MSHRCCTKQKVKRGLWSPEEDEKLTAHITTYGHGSWSSVPKLTGLQRCGKSCRLRWINYLRPDLKKGSFTQEEEQIIIDVHRILGNRWAQIAKHLPGRTDNEVKNFWNSCIKKKLMSQGLDPQTHNLLSSQYNRRSSGNTTTKNKSNNSFVLWHENNANRQQQEPVSAFSMISSSSHHETIITDNICSSDDQDHSTNIPFHLTLPNDVRYRNNIPISTCSSSLILGQNNDHSNLTANTSAFQHYGSISTPNNISSSSSSSLDVQNIPCLPHRDFGVWGSGFEPLDQTPRAMEVYDNQQSLNGYDNDYEQERHKDKDKDKDKIISSEMQNDRSSSFDLGYLESALMCDIMSRDLSSMEYEDHLSWNY